VGERVFLLDGTALAYRSYFAMKEPLRDSKGRNTTAIYGVVNSILKIMREEKPEYMIVAFDAGKPASRLQIFPEYKSTRVKMPDELKEQIPILKQVLEAMGISVVELEGEEADDVVATLTCQAKELGFEPVIVTADKDFFQLIDDKTKILQPGKWSMPSKWWDKNNAIERLGVPPERIVDLLAIMGDTSDNIPGISGIGEKGAQKLINEFESLDNIYLNIDKIPTKVKDRLIEGKESAYLSRELIRLKTDLPVKFEPERAKIQKMRTDELFELFKELEFHSLLKEFGFEELKKAKGEYRVVCSIEELEELSKRIKELGYFAIDLETDSLSPIDAHIVGISISLEEGKGYYIPVGHNVGSGLIKTQYSNLDLKSVLKLIKELVENKDIAKIGQNVKYDMLVLENYDIHLQNCGFDTMVASYLIDPGSHQHSLDYIAMRYLNYKMTTYKDVTKSGKKEIPFADVPIEVACEYSAEDADIALRLSNFFAPKLREYNLERVFHDVEIPLIFVLASMERAGVKIDTEVLRAFADEIQKRITVCEQEIYELAGERFNINSPAQLRTILFEKLRLPSTKKTKTGASTDVDVLEKLAEHHPLPKKIVEYRSYSKLLSTYFESLIKLVNPRTGRIHTSFNQVNTATGRLSSSDPNLQNIPVRGEFGREIRKAFVPEPGNIFISADYSQIDLRLLAHLSCDPVLIQAFEKDKDIHRTTASLILNKPIDEITPEDRRIAKTVNFGIIYGLSPYGLSQELNIEVDKAKEFIDNYFRTYQRTKQFIEETKEFAHKNGYVQTILGRRRYLPEINSENKNTRAFAERIAINTSVQGSSADLIKVAMINIHRELGERGRMILQVHDELLFEVKEEYVDELKELIRDRMENAMRLSVPVKADIGVGRNWFEAHP